LFNPSNIKQMKNYRILFLSVLIVFGIVSCNKNLDPDILSGSLRVDEAKNWFEDLMKGARIANDGLDRKEVFWQYAFETKFNEQSKTNVVIVPISHGMKNKLYGYKQLWLYKDKNNIITMRVVEFIHDYKIPKKQLGNYSLRNFTGTMLVREWNDEILGGLEYENGKLVAGLTDIEEIVGGKKKDKKNGRIKGSTCFSITSCFHGYNYVVGYDVGYSYSSCSSSINCVWIDSFGDVIPESESRNYQGGGVESHDFKFTRISNPCQGFSESLLNQYTNQKEMSGVITNDNEAIIFPSLNNTKYSVSIANGYTMNDMIGRPVVWFGQSGNDWEVVLYVYGYNNNPSNPGITATPFTYKVKGFFHTHPIESGYDYDNPSDADKTTAGNISGLQHYIVHDNSIIRYNSNGEQSRKNNWKNDCNGTKNFIN